MTCSAFPHPEHPQQALRIGPATRRSEVRATRESMNAGNVSTENGVAVAQPSVGGDDTEVFSRYGDHGSAVVRVRLEPGAIPGSRIHVMGGGVDDLLCTQPLAVLRLHEK